jgi:hypothetical protein
VKPIEGNLCAPKGKAPPEGPVEMIPAPVGALGALKAGGCWNEGPWNGAGGSFEGGCCCVGRGEGTESCTFWP